MLHIKDTNVILLPSKLSLVAGHDIQILIGEGILKPVRERPHFCFIIHQHRDRWQRFGKPLNVDYTERQPVDDVLASREIGTEYRWHALIVNVFR